MGKEAAGPPQPILIQGSAIIEPGETPATVPSTPSTATTPAQDLSTVENALAKVHFLQDNKPNTNGLLAVGLLFFFAVPLLLFVGLANMNHNTEVNQAFHRLQTRIEENIDSEK